MATSFENADARHQFAHTQGGALICPLDEKHLAVSGPNKSLNILSKLNLSLVANLDTDN